MLFFFVLFCQDIYLSFHTNGRLRCIQLAFPVVQVSMEIVAALGLTRSKQFIWMKCSGM